MSPSWASSHRLWSRDTAQEIDRKTSDEFGLPALTLMETAGRRVSQYILELNPQGLILILCGQGNNGGDGLVCARTLFNQGLDARAVILSDQGSPSYEQQLQACRLQGVPVLKADSLDSLSTDQATILVDAVLGLGMRGSLRTGPTLDLLKVAQGLTRRTVVAVDLPSGMDPDICNQQAIPLPANLTVTFGGLKLCHVGSPSRDLCGQVHCTEIGFPRNVCDHVLEHAPKVQLVADRSKPIQDPRSHLSPSAHKFDRGHILVLGGSRGKSGAPLLAARAAARMGSGWVTVATNGPTPTTPDWMTTEELWQNGAIDWRSLERFIVERKVRAIAIGPGTTQSCLQGDGVSILRNLTQTHNLGVVMDAGALRSDLVPLLQDTAAKSIHTRWLLTPHPGEWKKTFPNGPTPTSWHEIEQCQQLAARLGVTLIYKSATPTICEPSQTTFLGFGSNVLAKAGSGDVLTGALTFSLAAGLDGTDAFYFAYKGLMDAADSLTQKTADYGILPDELADSLARPTPHETKRFS